MYRRIKKLFENRRMKILPSLGKKTISDDRIDFKQPFSKEDDICATTN